MSRTKKILLIVLGSLGGLALLLVVAGVIAVQTDWFRNMVRTQIVSAVENATGGRAEVGSFGFDWRRLRAEVRNFVLHGLETPPEAPLFRANLLQVDLKLLSPLKGFVDIASLVVDTPQANVIAYPDGRTNVPSPKVKKRSDSNGLETIVNLAIGNFDLRNGSFTFGARKADFNAAGRNLRAQLTYNAVNPRYTGELNISPLHLVSGNSQALDVEVKLPVTLEKDRIAVAGGQLNTAASEIRVSGSVNHLNAPQIAAQIAARLSVDEMARAAGLTTELDTRNAPGVLTADIAASMTEDRIRVERARIDLGHSTVEASGLLRDPQGASSLRFDTNLVLGEVGRLMRVASRPEGSLRVGGNATLDANRNYQVRANVQARNVAVTQGTTRLAGLALDSSVTADPHRISFGGIRLAALGGSFTGSGAIEEMERFRLSGNLSSFGIGEVVRAFRPGQLGYNGVVSGPVEAAGSIKDTRDLVARANLAIAPVEATSNTVPVSGRLDVNYDGRGDTVTLGRSFLALPHTRLDLSGALGQRIDIRMVSRDFGDFRPLADVPVQLDGGTANITAVVSGKLSAPQITGQASMNAFSVRGRPFSRFAASLSASRSGAAVSNGVLERGALQAQFSGNVGLANWKAEERQPLRVDATIRNAGLEDVLALASQSDVRATGALTADAHITGTIGSPVGSADLRVMKGTLEGEPFDSLVAQASLTPDAIRVPALELAAGPSRLTATAEYLHPAGDLKRGAVRARVSSSQIQLAQFQSLVKSRPGLRGTLSIQADAAGNVQPGAAGSGFQLTAITADVSARGLQMEGRQLGDVTATANTAGAMVRYNVTSNFAGSNVRVNGESLLAGDHRTSATVAIANLPIDRVLAVAGYRELPLTGTLGANAELAGTLADPRGKANLSIASGSAYQEPFDSLQASIGYSSQLIELSSLRLSGQGANIELSGSFAHPAKDFANGQVRFRVNSNEIQLARLRTLQRTKPGLNGVVRLAADGAATLRRNSTPVFSALNANVAARQLRVNERPLGDLTATAETRGRELVFDLNSNFARADIRGNGRMDLAGDYPMNAQLSFARVTYSGLRAWTGGEQRPIEATMDGRLTISGPASRTDALRGRLELSRVEAHSTPRGGTRPRADFELHNAGPVVVALDRSVLTVESARITGPMTELSVTGKATTGGTRAMDIRADGKIKLEVLQAFSPEIFSSGGITLNAAVTGTMDQPRVNGKLQLENASFNMLSAPNGISDANGSVTFTGTEAVIDNITGESGGGKLALSGVVAYGGPEMQVRMQATAEHVRIGYPPTVTTEVSAKLMLRGSTSRSLVSGNVNILDVALHSQNDMGSMLSSAATPPPLATARTGFLAGMRFDVQIHTTADTQFRTTLAQNLHADANLTLRGSPDHPGMLGRVSVTGGEVVFFGAKYTIDQGNVSFFNPQKIDPVLNVDLATTVQGVDVSINVAGPMDRMKLSYRSDPPLQFSQIVSLLASGKTPTTDPVLAAHTPAAPEQNFEQAGASTLLGQAVANPVAGRLQRLFGVSKLSISPQITGPSNTTQATLTIQQQVTREITFTYQQDATRANSQVVRVEWAINPQWSAVAQRDVYGQVDLDFFYKKRFH